MLISYTTNKFPNEYIPTVFDNYSANLMVDDNTYNLGLWDTAGQRDYDRLRPLRYPNTDTFLICFALDSRDSFDNVRTKWVPEVKHHMTSPASLIIVGTKLDLRKPGVAGYVTTEEGQKLTEEVGGYKYWEVSALTQQNMKELFIDVVRAGLKKPVPIKTRRCIIL